SRAKIVLNRGLFAHSVLGNLITNAIKFSPVGGTINLHYRAEESFHVLEIQDQGTGISDEAIKLLKQRKTIESRTGTSGEKGTGFGLLIALHVIELHKGTIEFLTPESRGTLVRIRLPC